MRREFARARRTRSAALGFARHPRRVLGLAAELDQPSGVSIGEYLHRHLPLEVARAAAAQIMAHDHVVLDFERDGLRWSVDAGDDIGGAMYATGSYHGAEIDALVKRLKETTDRATLVDLGANAGTTSIPFALAGFRVVAVEPISTTYSMLVTNVNRNELADRIECVQSAISSNDAPVRMWTGYASGQAEIAVPGMRPSMAAQGGGQGDLVSVSARRLDTLISDQGIAPDDIALVWADVQGSETAVIETGQILWDAHVPLYLEVYPAGLELHGGMAAFVAAVERSFSGFLTSDEVLSKSTVRPINCFAAFARSLENRYDDALLVSGG